MGPQTRGWRYLGWLAACAQLFYPRVCLQLEAVCKTIGMDISSSPVREENHLGWWGYLLL